MALRNTGNRRGRRTRDDDRETSRTPKGAVRRTQMITTYGVGSLVALGDQSYIVSGLDTWAADREELAPKIIEPLLRHWLGVREFRLPPSASPSAGDGVKIRRFPEWYSCGESALLQPFGRFGSPHGKSECGSCGTPLTPSRFVVACVNGHLDDFPYWAWVHNKTAPSVDDMETKHELKLRSSGGSASLRSIVIECSCGKRASMEGAFGKTALEKLGVKCAGRRPWLGRNSEENECDEVLRALQRGSSAAWFPVQRSALSIPPWSRRIQRLLDPHVDRLARYGEDARLAAFETLADGTGFSVDEFQVAWEDRKELSREKVDDDVKLDASSRLRYLEYKKLRSGTSQVSRDDDFECEGALVDPSVRENGVDKVMLVKRLREVRALQSFTRIEMPDPTTPARRARLSLEDLGWLPAIEVSGEGVFLRFEVERLHDWEMRPGPTSRANHIRDNHGAQLLKRTQISGKKFTKEDVASPIDARFILLHTLTHTLINEWSLDCGYPAAALRERIYCSRGADEMAGILIYTATSDSAGSLGGVVGQGEPQTLKTSLESALNRISWCSQDPPCMESEASGTDSLNLAACYACVLLPETSCETNNTFLDRALLIGTPEDPEIGYFQGA